MNEDSYDSRPLYETAFALADCLNDIMEQLEWEHRRKCIEKVSNGFCTHCGTSNPNCQCWNDE